MGLSLNKNLAILACLVGVNQIAAATCARCQKIEADRAREQALHPKKVGYYEDEIGLATERESSFGTTSQTLKPLPSPESAQEEIRNGRSELKAREMLTDRPIPLDPSSQRKPESASSFSTLAIILQANDLIPTLSDSFTLIIPSNEAFRRMPPGTLEMLLRPENKERLKTFTRNYVVATKINQETTKVKNLNGADLNISKQGDTFFINGARVVLVESLGKNGMIMIVDRVLFPSH